ncbi:MAG: hypothetical protein EOO41_00915, partial [Methanobacteriota archaeon]
MLYDAGLLPGRQLRPTSDAQVRAAARLLRHFRLRSLHQQQRASGDAQLTELLEALRTPAPGGLKIEHLLRLRVLLQHDMVRPDHPWRFAPVLVTSNLVRAIINDEQVRRFGRFHRCPIIAWWPRVRTRSSALVRSRAHREVATAQDLRGLHVEDRAALLQLFVPGAPAMLSQNVCIHRGIVNGAWVTLHSITLSTAHATAELNERIQRAAPGELIFLDTPPTSVNVRLATPQPAAWPADLRLGVEDGAVILPLGVGCEEEVELRHTPARWLRRVKVVAHPVELAFSITYHKAQGATLNHVILDIRTMPDVRPPLLASSFYVGVSRVRSSECMRIIPLRAPFVMNHLLRLRPPDELFYWLAGFDATSGEWLPEQSRAAMPAEEAASTGRRTRRRARQRTGERTGQQRRRGSSTQAQPPAGAPPTAVAGAPPAAPASAVAPPAGGATADAGA